MIEAKAKEQALFHAGPHNRSLREMSDVIEMEAGMSGLANMVSVHDFQGTLRMDKECKQEAEQQQLRTTVDTITSLLDDVLNGRNDFAVKSVESAPIRQFSPWWSLAWLAFNFLGAVGFASAVAYFRSRPLVCDDSVCNEPSVGDTPVWRWCLWAMLAFICHGLGDLARRALKFTRHDVVRCNTFTISACCSVLAGYINAEILLVRDGRFAIWVLRIYKVLVAALLLWALKGIFVIFVERKFCPPYRIHKEEDSTRRERVLNRLLDSSVLQGNAANIPALKGVTCVNAVALQYVSLLKHSLQGGEPSQLGDKPDALYERVERLESELTELIPDAVMCLADRIGVSVSNREVEEWIRDIKRSVAQAPPESLQDARARKVATIWLDKTRKRRASRSSIESERFDMRSPRISSMVREYAVKTECVRSMLLDLRMDMLVDSRSLKLPSATQSSRPHDVKSDNLYAKKLGFYIFWQLKQDSHRIQIISKDLEPFFDSEEELCDAWSVLDPTGSDRVDLVDCVQFVKGFSKLRREVACMKLDSIHLMSSINQSLAYAAICILLLVVLEVTELAKFSNIWQACSAAIIVFSFVFGNSIRQAWENLIYILSVRAFDVGDTIIVNGTRQVVNRIMLGFVECTGSNNTLVNIPMQHFLDKEIVNITRTVDVWETVEILVDTNTTAAQLSMVADVVAKTIFSRKSLFAGLYRVQLKPSGMIVKSWTMVVRYNLRGNGSDLVERGRADTIMCIAIATAMVQACINGTRVGQVVSMDQDDGPF